VTPTGSTNRGERPGSWGAPLPAPFELLVPDDLADVLLDDPELLLVLVSAIVVARLVVARERVFPLASLREPVAVGAQAHGVGVRDDRRRGAGEHEAPPRPPLRSSLS
jgi:hypothetical protein